MNEGVLGHGPRKVLVVDDHVDTVEILAILFRMLGHEPWTLTLIGGPCDRPEPVAPRCRD